MPNMPKTALSRIADEDDQPAGHRRENHPPQCSRSRKLFKDILLPYFFFCVQGYHLSFLNGHMGFVVFPNIITQFFGMGGSHRLKTRQKNFATLKKK